MTSEAEEGYRVKGNASQKEKAFLISTNCSTRCVPSPLHPPPAWAGCIVCSLFFSIFLFFSMMTCDMRSTFRVYAQKGVYFSQIGVNGLTVYYYTLSSPFPPFFFCLSAFSASGKVVIWSRTSIYDKTRTCNFSVKVIPKYQATCMWRDVNKQNM